MTQLSEEQYYLLKLSEEAAEVSQMVSKTIQFGLDEVFAPIGQTNQERLQNEINDFLAVIEVLNEKFGFSFSADAQKISAKKEKMHAYFLYSQECQQSHQP